ncbi:MAG TPA: ATP-dependent RNA helicase HrpA [Actinomycetes bacterium]|nr:ATP-dependent RNA helicase HrpA [Actinomycetes bacterium]
MAGRARRSRTDSPERTAHREAGRAALLPISYPDLPVAERRHEIATAIRDHQVVIVAGETGSGKTTQLPKICLDLGRGVAGLIGHTQPRRLAARTVADRIAEELGVELGGAVGYSVRFTDKAGADTLVRLMTDGILLAEIQRDRELRRYDTIIIDEAHERSLNIDFLLGYLKQLLPRRPDLKLIVTSATIDTARFAEHFDGAPVVEVSGRTYPVEMRYRPVVDPDDDATDQDRDQTGAVLDAVDELMAEGPGDILVFFSGEREIRDTAEALRPRLARRREHVDVLPLYARLSAAEQHNVFASHAVRRVVLATNVAETSLTVPGIRYVIDPGTARVSRYSHRLKVQRLPIEAVSQASANQRAGRCGRTSDGVCIRLYSEADFEGRPEFTEPEILRTNLASVILAMTALGLGDIAAFPFVEPPDRRQVKDGVALLEELGALDPAEPDVHKRLTALGRRLARLPVDPRLGRMVLEADRNGVLPDVLVIAAALSIQDPRERPPDHQQAADEKHRRFADDRSDFVGYVNLWRYLQEQQKALSGSAFRRLCRTEFLHYLRIREWQDLVGQLRQVAKSLAISTAGELSEPGGDAQRVHTALLPGLLSHIGLWDPDKREYAGARGASFAPWPGSALFKKPPRWVMAGELVETSRLWGRDLGRVEPEWVEPLAAHLVKRTYSEPHWSAKSGAAMALERVTLYGVPLVAGRKVTYGRIDLEVSRALFIRHALVQGEWRTHHRFFHHNRELLEDVSELEHRSRRRDILVDDETLEAFYDERVPADVVSARHFDAWWKTARRDAPDMLTFDPAMLVRADADEVSRADFPDSWDQGDLSLPLSYQFEPGAAADGVTVHVPLEVLNRVQQVGFDWQVPGLRGELATALVRSLPKSLRRSFVPAPDSAAAALARMGPDVRDEPFTDALAAELARATGVEVRHDEWDLARVPDHLRMTFRVEREDGSVAGEGKDLTEVRRALAPTVAATVAAAAADVERTGLTSWSFGELETEVVRPAGDRTVRAYPALVDEGGSVALRVVGTPAQAAAATRAGLRRLLLLSLPSPLPGVVGRLDNATKLALADNPHGSVPLLLEDCLGAVLDDLVRRHGGTPRDEAGFARLRADVRPELPNLLYDVVSRVARILRVAHEVAARTTGSRAAAVLPSLLDVRAHVARLVRPGFVTDDGLERLADVERYLRADSRRLEVLAAGPARDRERLARVAQVEQEHESWLAGLRPERRDDEAVRAVRWMLEELRVSVFAQQLGTPNPVSEKRIRRAMDAVG